MAAKTKQIRLRTTYASAEHGAHGPGSKLTVSAKEADDLVRGGYAELIDESTAPEGVEYPPEIEAAVKALVGRHSADALADIADTYEIQILARDTKAMLAAKIATARKALSEDLIEGKVSGDTQKAEGDDAGKGDEGEGDSGEETEEAEGGPRERDLAPS